MADRTIEHLLAIAEVLLLNAGGIDNWDGYDDAMAEHEKFMAENPSVAPSAESYLLSLKNEGVDNWTWYDDSREGLAEYEEYLHTLEDLNIALNFFSWKLSLPAPEPEIASVPVVKVRGVEGETEKLLHTHISEVFGADEADRIFSLAIKDGIWKYSTFTTEFKASIKTIQEGVENPMENARATLYAKVLKNGKLDKFLKNLA
jgi:hypothetical protein